MDKSTERKQIVTEQVSTTIMDREEFEERHSRTGQYIARVGKIWEHVAEEQQSIIDGKGYTHLGYATWAEYWNNEWKEASGWAPQTVKNWMMARRTKLETPSTGDGKYEPQSVEQWKDLTSIQELEQRNEFLERYEEEFKPQIPTGMRAPFREAIKEFKGERTAREVLSPSDMADLPDPELTASEKWVYEAGKIVAALRRLRPQEVAEDTYRLMPDKLEWEIDAANQIIGWYEQYKQALQAQKNQGLRAVK